MKSALLRELATVFFLEADDAADDNEAQRLALVGAELVTRSLDAMKLERAPSPTRARA